MANLYGRLQGNRGEATRCGSSVIRAKLETWQGSIQVVLEKDGHYCVTMGDKYAPRYVVASGNVNTDSPERETDALDYSNDAHRADVSAVADEEIAAWGEILSNAQSCADG